MKSWLIAGAMLVAGAPLIAQSAPPAPPPPPIVMVAPDALGGKPTTRAEAEAQVRAEFARGDTNRDGFVTRDEISAQVEARMAEARTRQFDALDTNKDGRLSREEFAARPQRERIVERRYGREPGGAAGNEQREVRVFRMDAASGKRGAMRNGGLMIAMADSDRDGRISLKEAVDGTLAQFDRADANKDGTLTPDERRQSFAQWGERMRVWGRGMRGRMGDVPPPPPAPLAPPGA